MKWPTPDHLAGYMNRWWLTGIRRKRLNIRLHHILRSDDDRALHDHPWNYLTIILWGGYLETTVTGTKWRGPGSVIFSPAARLHRLTLIEGRPAWTLFIFGRKVREWGFATPTGWVFWKSYPSTERFK